MDSALIESPTLVKSPGFGYPIGSNFEILLKESVDRFLSEIQKEAWDFSGFRSIFFRLLQSRADPPLEIIWFYSAVSYHENLFSKKEVRDRVFAVKDLFQLLVACSTSCNGSKSIALLAPVLSELCQVIVEVDKSKKFSAKETKKLRKEIESLVEGIVSYISICSGKNYNGGGAFVALMPCFVDLVRVWTVRQLDGREGLGLLFPLVSDEVRDELAREGSGIGYLAGVVTVEAFMLRLCLKLQVGEVSKQDLRKELRIWAVASITGFRNHDFFEILLKLLLDPTLPVIFPLSSEDEGFLREILCDSVILVDYAFLSLGTEVEHSNDHMINIALIWLVVTHEAIEAARDNGDQGKAISYVNAFSRSCLPSGLIKWVINQIGTEKVSRPNATAPRVLLKWLLNLEEQGFQVFEHDISKLRAKLLFDESKVICKDQMYEADSKEMDKFFFFDKKGEEAKDGAKDQEMESMDDVFLSAAHMMKSQEFNGRRKRKEQRGSEGDMQVKFLKYKLHDSSVKEYFLPSGGDGMSSGSEVENPPSDEDMEETEE